MVLAYFTDSLPAWVAPVGWFKQKFCGEVCDGEWAMNAEDDALLLVGAIHLTVIAIVAYLAFRWRKRHRGQS